MLEAALVVVVGRPDQGLAEPGQREDRAVPAGRHDRGRVHRQALAIEQDVGAAARAGSPGTSSSVVQLLGPDPVRPHAGRVHDVRRPRSRSARRVSCSSHTTPAALPALLDQLDDRRAVHAHRAEALRLAEHRQHQPRVVGLAVVEEVRGGRVARRERRDQLQHLVARRSCGGGRGSSTRRPRAPPRAAARRRARGLRSDITSYMFSPTPMRRSRRAPSNAGTRNGSGFTRCGASRTISWRSTQRLAHQPEVEVLQVAQAAVDHLRRAARGAAREVVALDERDREPARGGVEARRRRR